VPRWQKKEYVGHRHFVLYDSYNVRVRTATPHSTRFFTVTLFEVKERNVLRKIDVTYWGRQMCALYPRMHALGLLTVLISFSLVVRRAFLPSLVG
jgi:hypothetical protein